MKTLNTLIATSIGLSMTLSMVMSANAQMQGEAKAIERVRAMTERLGGQEAWTEAGGIYLEYQGWETLPSKPLIEEAWRDLTKPVTLMTYRRGMEDPLFLEFHQRPDDSWLVRRGEMRPFDEDTKAENAAFWPRDFYTILRRLAVEDPDLSVTIKGNRVDMQDDGEPIGWFEIDTTGQPVRWGSTYGDDALSFVYGPVVEFDGVAFPKWGANIDGSWRFDYTAVKLLPRGAVEAHLADREVLKDDQP